MGVGIANDDAKLRIVCMLVDNGGDPFRNFSLIISWECEVHIQIIERPQAIALLQSGQIDCRDDLYSAFQKIIWFVPSFHRIKKTDESRTKINSVQVIAVNTADDGNSFSERSSFPGKF